MEELFKVWIQPIDKQSPYFCDSKNWVPVSKVEEALYRLLKGPSRMFWQRVWVVDQLDCTNFDWNKDDGIVFPTPEDLKD